jgi:spermidine synthase
VIGLALMHARQRLPLVYAANLLGSGIGALAAPLAMALWPPVHLPTAAAVVTLLGASAVPRSARCIPAWPVCVTATGVLGLVWWMGPDRLSMDDFKYGSYVQQLVAQGDARIAAEDHSAQGLVQVYRGDVFHDLPFVSVAETPPPMLTVTVDGHQVGSLLRITAESEAGALDHVLTAAPYDLLPAQPDVLLLGETGGANIWLALRHNARTIRVAQPNKRLVELLRDELADEGGAVWHRARVANVSPRLFVEEADERFDLIQVVTLEGLATGGAGMAGLAEDHLVTVLGLARCLERLTDDGLLVVCRGIQEPPRDNLKYLATVAAALRAGGVAAPDRHVLIFRDFLAVCTVVKATPWTDRDTEAIRRMLARRQLTPVWFPDIQEAELNTPDQLPGPENSAGDWYHFAARQLLTDGHDPDAFIESWTFDIRPPTDDRPFFSDYFRVRAIHAMRQAFGERWLTRAELAYLFVAVASVLIGLVGAALTVTPLLSMPAVRVCPGKTAAARYFVALGLAYMAIEMTALSWMMRIIGQPVTAAALTIAAFLLGSGVGSLIAQRVQRHRTRAVWLAVIGILVWAFVLAALHPHALRWLAPLPMYSRALWSIGAIIPLVVVMGVPMPLGLARLDRVADALVPWAWGVNGFASVLAPPLATLVAMTWGWQIAGVAALLMYLAAGASFKALTPSNCRAEPGNPQAPRPGQRPETDKVGRCRGRAQANLRRR